MRMLRQWPVKWGHGIRAWARGHRRVSGGVGGVLLLLLVAAALAPAPGSGTTRSGAVGALAEPAPVAIPTTPGPAPAPLVAPPVPSAVPPPSSAAARVTVVPPPAPSVASTSPVETTPAAEQTAAPTPMPSATPDQGRPTRPATASYRSCADARAAGAAPLHRGQPGYRSALDDDGDGTACEQDRPSALCDEGAGARRGGLPILEYLSCWLPDL